MGLDMYLYAEVKAPKGSALAEVVEKHLTDEHREWLADPNDGQVYVGGWKWQKDEGETAFYDALCIASGMHPDENSPHFNVYLDGRGGYLVEATIFYWRKANAIHRWFVEEVQEGVDECQRSPVGHAKLMELVEACEEVHLDHSKADSTLPTRGGFFFGGTEYDGWYFKEMEDTAVHLKGAIANCPAGVQFVYRSSW